MKKFRINIINIVPILLASIVYLLSYQVPKFLVSMERVHYLSTSIDESIKLFSPAILIYVGAFFQWGYGLLIATTQEKKKTYKNANAIIIGSLIAFAIFMIYPTGVYRPQIEGNTIFDEMMNIIYTVDNVINACPSLHCFCSTMVVIELFRFDNIDSKTKILNIIFTMLVYISTILTKQHTLIDIPFGILLAFVGVYLSKYIKFDRVFDYINEKIGINKEH